MHAAAARIALLDYGMGNVRSAEKALERVGAVVERTGDPGRARGADGFVLPGDGAFPRAMQRIGALGLDHVVRDAVDRGTPVLGICVGMQLLFDGSVELGGAEGLGLLPGRVEALDAPGLKVPHIGWNPVSFTRPAVLTRALPDPCPFYHVHSFAPVPAREEDVAGTAVYGTPFVSVVERGRLFGVQFHPEKSGPDGLGMLQNFVALCQSRVPVPAAAA